MSRHKDLFKKISKLESDETPYAIASVYQAHGSSSGKVGDKALFDEQGKRIIGYIGGGCIENRVAATAKESLIDGIPKTIEIDLDSDEMGMFSSSSPSLFAFLFVLGCCAGCWHHQSAQ